MKPIYFAALLLILSQIYSVLSYAEENALQNTNANADTNATVETDEPQTYTEEVRYIKDTLYVPLRSGDSSGHRVVHKGLKSGTQVMLLQSNKETGYSLVRTTRGTEGWLRSQYLLEQPTAILLLKQAEKTIQQLSSKAGPMSEKLITAEKKNQSLDREIKKLSRENNSLNKELARIKNLSSNVVALDQENKEILKDNELKKDKLDSVKAENQRLEDQLKHEGFINGSLAVLLGIISTLVIQYLVKSGRRNDWA